LVSFTQRFETAQDLVAIEPEWLPELAPHMFRSARPTL